MFETIVKYKEMTPEENERWQKFYEEIRHHDEASALGGAKREGYVEGKADGLVEGETAANLATLERMRKAGFTEEQIKLALGENYHA